MGSFACTLYHEIPPQLFYLSASTFDPKVPQYLSFHRYERRENLTITAPSVNRPITTIRKEIPLPIDPSHLTTMVFEVEEVHVTGSWDLKVGEDATVEGEVGSTPNVWEDGITVVVED